MRFPTPVAGLTLDHQPEPVILRMALCGEARGEQDEGGRLEAMSMLGVLWVAENRRTDRSARWPLVLRDVFLQPYQFSCFNARDPNRAALMAIWRTDAISWERADTVCDLFEEHHTIDPTLGSTHYCTQSLWGINRPGAWYGRDELEAGRTVRLVQIGAHVFGRAA